MNSLHKMIKKKKAKKVGPKADVLMIEDDLYGAVRKALKKKKKKKKPKEGWPKDNNNKP